MNEQPIDSSCAEKIIRDECQQSFPDWGTSVSWFACELSESDFRSLLVFDGGSPLSRWQEYSDGSYEIGKVAEAVRNYRGNDPSLRKWQKDVLDYQAMIDTKGPQKTYCLVRLGNNGRITLFETNRRALSYYLHCFLFRKAAYETRRAVLAQVKQKLPLQSE